MQFLKLAIIFFKLIGLFQKQGGVGGVGGGGGGGGGVLCWGYWISRGIEERACEHVEILGVN